MRRQWLGQSDCVGKTGPDELSEQEIIKRRDDAIAAL
jgi:hypothetical protein